MSNSQAESGVGRPAARPADQPGSRLDVLHTRSVKRKLLQELSQSHAHGAPLRPEDLLARWPNDPAGDCDVASLLYEDYCRREQNGECPSLAEYQQRFPGQRDALPAHFQHQSVLRSLRVSGSEPAPLALPGVGDEVFGFRLRHELGSGAFARVFLAEQIALAGRPVVLKVSAADGKEPQTLAQLQHSHIVPIYSYHENSAAGLRAVCMPFFGGASLSRVFSGALWRRGRASRRRQRPQIVRALLQAVQRITSLAPAPGRGPAASCAPTPFRLPPA